MSSGAAVMSKSSYNTAKFAWDAAMEEALEKGVYSVIVSITVHESKA